VNDFLIKKGFPIVKVDPSEAVKTAEELLGKKHNVWQLLDKLENPANIIANIVEKLAAP
jgi:predicted glycosyltransferase